MNWRLAGVVLQPKSLPLSAPSRVHAAPVRVRVPRNRGSADGDAGTTTGVESAVSLVFANAYFETLFTPLKLDAPNWRLAGVVLPWYRKACHSQRLLARMRRPFAFACLATATALTAMPALTPVSRAPLVRLRRSQTLFAQAAAGWTTLVDPNGYTYYYNEQTGQSQWEAP